MTGKQDNLIEGNSSSINIEDFENPDIEPLLNSNGDTYAEPPVGLDEEVDRTNPIAYSHVYWTKKPYPAIQYFIEQMTEEGDVVLDNMAGSGMTGVAALASGRKTILADISPAATWIAKNNLTPVDLNELQNAFERVAEDVEDEIQDLYKAVCSDCGNTGTLAYLRYSEVHTCKRCGTEINLDEAEQKPRTSKYYCPGCESEMSPNSQEPTDIVPVGAIYSCDTCGGRGNKERDIIQSDLDLLGEIEEKEIPYWYPKNEMLPNSRINVNEGMSIPDLYTKRNLIALSTLRNSILEQTEEGAIRNALLFTFTAILPITTRMVQDRDKNGILKGTYYIPPKNKEANVWNTFAYKFNRNVSSAKEHIADILDKDYNPETDARVYTADGRDMSNIPDESIDYAFIDPPYGDTVPYSEVNYLWSTWLQEDEDFDKEIVVSDSSERKDKDEDKWEEEIQEVFEEVYKKLKPGRWVTITFNNSDPTMWERFNNAIIDIGFTPYNGSLSLDMKQKSWKQMKEDKAQRRDTVVNYFKLPESMNDAEFETPPEEIPEDIMERVTTAIDNVVRSGYLGRGVLPEQVFHEVIKTLKENNALNLRPDWESILEENYEKNIDDRGRTRWHPPDYHQEYDPDLAYFSTDLIAQRAIEEYLEENGGSTYSDLYEVVTNEVDQQPENFDELLERNFIKERKKWRLPETEDEKLEVERRQEGHQEHVVDKFVSKLENDEHIEEAPPLHVLEYGIRYLQEEDRHREALLLYDYIDIEELPEDVQSNIRRRRRISEAKAEKTDGGNEEGESETDPAQSTLEDIDQE